MNDPELHPVSINVKVPITVYNFFDILLRGRGEYGCAVLNRFIEKDAEMLAIAV